jgi:hypothetical protein
MYNDRPGNDVKAVRVDKDGNYGEDNSDQDEGQGKDNSPDKHFIATWSGGKLTCAENGHAR